MTVSDPYPQSKFAIDGQDIVVDGLENSITFMIDMAGSGIIINETYNYDNDGRVVIRDIADLMAKCVYGELSTGLQADAGKMADFYINGELLFRRTVYASRFHNPLDPNGQKYVMAASTRRTCHLGHPFYVTTIGQQEADLYDSSGRMIAYKGIGAPASEGGAVYTTDCEPSVLFPIHYRRAAYMVIRDEMRVDILREFCPDAIDVRFLNRYDVMESLMAHHMTEKPAVQDDVSLIGGRRTRFSVKSNTDYTLYSGNLSCQEEFDTWQDLLIARKAQIYWRDQWIDIIITKANYTRQRRQFYGSQVEITFQTANPLMLL